MAKHHTKRVCKYCGATAHNGTDVCSTCTEKIPIVRKITAIGHMIKRQAIFERMEAIK